MFNMSPKINVTLFLIILKLLHIPIYMFIHFINMPLSVTLTLVGHAK